MAAAAAIGAGSRTCRIAVAQMRSTDAVEENFAAVRRLVQQASKAQCSLISLPECFEWMGSGPDASLAFAQPISGPLFTRYRGLAKEFQIWISYGGFHERPAEDEADGGGVMDGRICNAHLLVAPDGEVVANYHKAHLFDVDTADGVFHESSFTRPGTEQVMVSNTPAGNIGLTTCYDLRFPHTYANLRAAGATVLLVPSAFMPSTGAAHWETLLRARAIETQCYVAAAAQYGQHNPKRGSYGHSIIVDPWGEVVAALGGDGEGIAVAEIDPARLAAVRAKMPVLDHAKAQEALYTAAVNVVDGSGYPVPTS